MLPSIRRGLSSVACIVPGQDEEVLKMVDSKELVFFKKLIHAVVTKPKGEIDYNAAILLSKQSNEYGGGNLSNWDAQQCIDKLVRQSWLAFRQAFLQKNLSSLLASCTGVGGAVCTGVGGAV